MVQKDIEKSVKKAKKEIREAEEFTDRAKDKVVSVAKKEKGKKKRVFTKAARDLEKAVYSAGESCEATEEAEAEIKKVN